MMYGFVPEIFAIKVERATGSFAPKNFRSWNFRPLAK